MQFKHYIWIEEKQETSKHVKLDTPVCYIYIIIMLHNIHLDVTNNFKQLVYYYRLMLTNVL